MSEAVLTTLQDILAGIEGQSTTGWLYLPAEGRWTESSKCVVLESEEVPPELEDAPDAGVPEFAKTNNLLRTLPVTVVQDVVANARQQKPAVTLGELVGAFLYYYKHDAFIDIAV